MQELGTIETIKFNKGDAGIKVFRANCKGRTYFIYLCLNCGNLHYNERNINNNITCKGCGTKKDDMFCCSYDKHLYNLDGINSSVVTYNWINELKYNSDLFELHIESCDYSFSLNENDNDETEIIYNTDKKEIVITYKRELNRNKREVLKGSIIKEGEEIRFLKNNLEDIEYNTVNINELKKEYIFAEHCGKNFLWSIYHTYKECKDAIFYKISCIRNLKKQEQKILIDKMKKSEKYAELVYEIINNKKKEVQNSKYISFLNCADILLKLPSTNKCFYDLRETFITEANIGANNYYLNPMIQSFLNHGFTVEDVVEFVRLCDRQAFNLNNSNILRINEAYTFLNKLNITAEKKPKELEIYINRALKLYSYSNYVNNYREFDSDCNSILEHLKIKISSDILNNEIYLSPYSTLNKLIEEKDFVTINYILFFSEMFNHSVCCRIGNVNVIIEPFSKKISGAIVNGKYIDNENTVINLLSKNFKEVA